MNITQSVFDKAVERAVQDLLRRRGKDAVARVLDDALEKRIRSIIKNEGESLNKLLQEEVRRQAPKIVKHLIAGRW